MAVLPPCYLPLVPLAHRYEPQQALTSGMLQSLIRHHPRDFGPSSPAAGLTILKLRLYCQCWRHLETRGPLREPVVIFRIDDMADALSNLVLDEKVSHLRTASLVRPGSCLRPDGQIWEGLQLAATLDEPRVSKLWHR